MSDPRQARNDTDDSTTEEQGQLAYPGPVPDEPEDVADTGERPGDLAPQAGPDRDHDDAHDSERDLS